MTREAFAAFPTFGIPRFLEARAADPQHQMALLYRALDETLRLLSFVEFARHLAPEAGAEGDGDRDRIGKDLERRLAALRLVDTASLLSLAREQRREPCPGFPSLLPGDEEDDGDVWGAIDAWVAHREAWLSNGEIDADLAVEAPNLRALLDHLDPGEACAFFHLRGHQAERLHAFHTITPLSARRIRGATLKPSSQTAELDIIVAEHLESGASLRLDAFFFEYGGAVFGHYAGLGRQSAIDPSTGYLFFSSRPFIGEEPKRQGPLGDLSEGLPGLRGALYDAKLEYLGQRGDDRLVWDRQERAYRWLRIPQSQAQRNAMMALEAASGDTPQLLRFSALDCQQRYPAAIYVSEPLRTPSLEALLLWSPDLSIETLAGIVLATVEGAKGLRGANIGLGELGATFAANLVEGSDGQWKVLPTLEPHRWDDGEALGSLSRLADGLPGTGAELANKAIDRLRSLDADSFSAWTAEARRWSEASEALGATPEARAETSDYVLQRELSISLEACPALPDREPGKLLAALDKEDRGTALGILDKKIDYFGETSPASLFWATKGALLLEKDEEAGLAAMEAALRCSSHNLSAINALARYYEALPNDEKAYEFGREQLQLAESLHERAVALRALLRLTSERLDRPAEALDLADDLAALFGDDLANLVQRQGFAAAAGDTERELSLMERELELLPANAVERRLALLRRLVEAYSGRHGEEARALDFAGEMIDLAPGEFETLRTVMRVLPDNDISDRALSVLKTLKEQADFLNDSENTEVLLRLGTVLRRRHEDYSSVAQAFEDVLSRNAGNRRALEELITLEQSAERYAEAAETMKRLLVQLDEPEARAKTLATLGRLLVERLGDNRNGLEMLKQSLELRPESLDVFTDLLRWAEASGADDLASEAYRLRAEGVTAGADAEQNAVMQFSLEWLWFEERRGTASKRLFEIVEAALAKSPWRRVLWAELERLVREHGESERFISAVEADIEGSIEAFGEEMIMKAATFAEAHIEDAERAVALLAELLDRDRIGRAGLVRLLRLFARTNQMEQAEGVLTFLEQAVSDDEERRSLYMAIATELEGDPDTVPLALSYFEKVLQSEPRHAAAWQHVKAIHEGMEDWNALLDALERESEHFPERRGQLRLQIADLLESRLARVKDGLDIVLEEVRAGHAGEEGLQRLMDREMSEEEWRNIASAIHESLRATANWELRRHYLESLAYLYEVVLKDDNAASDILIEWFGVESHDEELLNRIVTLLLRADRWQDVLHFYRNYLSLTEDGEERARILEKMAEIYEVSFDKPVIALKLLDEALSGVDGAERVRLLLKVREVAVKHGFWEAAISNIQDQISAGVISQLELLHTEAGNLWATKIGDLDEAAAAYEAALDANKDHVPALAGLLSIRRKREEWSAVLALVERVEALTTSVEERVALRIEAATLARDKARDPELAITLYGSALDLMPERVDLVLPLLELYTAARRWEDAEGLGERATEGLLTIEDSETRLKILQHLGRVNEELRRDDMACLYYEKALAAVPDAIEVELGLAFAYDRLGRDVDALTIFRALMDKEIDRLPKASLAAIKRKIKELTLKVETPENRLQLLEAAAAEQSKDPEILRELLPILREEKDWEKTIAYAKTLAAMTPYEEEQIDLLMEIADGYFLGLDRADVAVEHYENILERWPAHASAYIKLLDILLKQSKYMEAIALLERFVAVDKDTERRSSVLYSLGVLVRDHTQDTQAALAWFNQSLDLDASRLEAFSAIEEIVARMGDGKAQVENYQLMIQRIKGKGKTGLEYKLFLNLGKIFLSTLHEHENAVVAFEKAAALKPEEFEPLEFLVELADADDMKAIVHERMLSILPTRQGSLKFLRGHYTKKRQHDRVWNLCATIRLLGMADEKEEQFYRAYEQKAIRIKKAPLAADVAEKLLCRAGSDKLLPTGTLLGMVDRLVGDRLRQRDGASLSYPLSGALTVSEHGNLYALAGLLKEILGVERIAFAISNADFYCKKEHLDQPTLILGQRVLEQTNVKHSAFTMGKYMASFRPENIGWRMYPLADLRALLLGALKAFRTSIPVPENDKAQVEAVARVILAHEDTARREELHGAVERFLDQGAVIDINAWARNVELNVNRYGLAVSNDIQLSLAAMKAEGIYAEGLSPEAAVKDLLFYQVSAQYSRLKKVIGTALRVE